MSSARQHREVHYFRSVKHEERKVQLLTTLSDGVQVGYGVQVAPTIVKLFQYICVHYSRFILKVIWLE